MSPFTIHLGFIVALCLVAFVGGRTPRKWLRTLCACVLVLVVLLLEFVLLMAAGRFPENPFWAQSEALGKAFAAGIVAFRDVTTPFNLLVLVAALGLGHLALSSNRPRGGS